MIKVSELVSSLIVNKVQFVIIGGQAAVLHGSAYITADIDFCYSRDKENLERVVSALKPFHPYLRGAEKNLPFIFDSLTLKNGLNFTFSTDVGDIDLLGEVSGLGTYQGVLSYSEDMEIYGMQCKVLTLQGLIKAKKSSGRQKDLILLKELEALLEIRDKQSGKT